MSKAKKSKGYDIGGSKYSFDFVNGKIIGIKNQMRMDNSETHLKMNI